VFWALVLGCANTPEPGSADVYVPSISALKPEEYPGEIDKYNKIIQGDLHLDIQRENLKLQKKIGKLQQTVRNLKTSNAQLNKTIEMLSTLDSRLEEKRSNFIKTESTEEE